MKKGDFLFLDAGTTTEKMIDHLIVRDVTFVTNGFIHAKKLAVKGYKVFITGGEIKSKHRGDCGSRVRTHAKKLQFHKVLYGHKRHITDSRLYDPRCERGKGKGRRYREQP